VVRENGEAEAAKKTELVVGRGKAVVGVLAGEVMEGDGQHGVVEGREVGMDMAGGSRGGSKKGVGLLLKVTVDVAGKGGKAKCTVGEIGEEGWWGGGRSIGGRSKVGKEEGRASRVEEGALMAGLGGP
jgi:hypothetical protein